MQGTARTYSGIAMILLLLPILLAFAPSRIAAQHQYHYFDDFSTTKADVDSYDHSGMYEPPCPGLGFSGWLCYDSDSLGDRGLGFHGAFTLEPDPHLAYIFPLEIEVLQITDGVVGFEIPELLSLGGYLRFFLSYDGTSLAVLDTIVTPGIYDYPVSPSHSCDSLYIWFSGRSVLLDDLTVTLNCTTAAVGPTWGSVKRLFR